MKHLQPKRDYEQLLTGLGDLLENARHSALRAVNQVMTSMYWEVVWPMVEFEQGGKKRGDYGKALLGRLESDMTTRFGRGFPRQNLQHFRQFYLAFPSNSIRSTLSSK